MVDYELVIILNKELNFKRRIEIIREIMKFILDNQGVVLKIQYLGLQSTFYSKKAIDSDKKGKYTLLQVSLKPSSVKLLNSIIKQNTNIIRHLITKSN